VFVAAAYVVIALLSLGGLPGSLATSGSCPTWFYLGGTFYCGESVPVTSCSGLPSQCVGLPGPGVEFHGVLFRLSLAPVPGGKADLGGLVTEPNNTTYRVLLLVTPLTGGLVIINPGLNWTSPDHSTTVWWPPQYFGRTAGGGISGNVTLGVAAP
jgi:hypothetical protein